VEVSEPLAGTGALDCTPLRAADQTLMIGSTIGKYRIVGQLGRGGAGIVYKAVDESLNREVAIKTLNPDLANTDVMKRFRAEATILAQLNHPQIATIHELFKSDDDLLMVMEYVRGETLAHLSERLGPMPPDGAAYLVDQILSALEHAHRAGIVHRDMKLANVMVTEVGGIKIMDFGIARVRGAEQMTVDGRLMGTPAYMPPEQVLGQDVDGRTDLYAVGVIFYRLLTGALPFTAESALALLQRQILEAPLPLGTLRPGLPEWCEPIVRRALAKAPTDRFQTAEEFREALGRATGLLMMSDLAKTFAVEVGDIQTTQGVSETLDLSRLEEATVKESARRNWRVGAFAVAATAICAALLGYATLRRPGAEPATIPVVVEPAASPRMAQPLAPPAAAPDIEITAPPPVPRAARAEGVVNEAPLVFETHALIGTKKPREHEALLVIANGKIVVTSELESEYPFHSIPYRSVVSISYSRGRDPLWNSPQGPSPVTRGGGTLGRLGIVVARNWISLRTNTQEQFIAMRFNEVLVRRVLLALEERTGRKPQLIADPVEDK
jgi:predicted Ser/Thr protein kinase